MKTLIRIDIASDVVCPWCYIGKRRFERAIEAISDRYNFEIRYQPFELNPNIPASGLNQKQYLKEKFGGESRYAEITEHVTKVAAQEGLHFNFKAQQVSPNTRKAHTIIQYAEREGRQIQTVEAFFKAYFTDGVDLSKDDNLITIATKVGLDPVSVKNVLEDENALLQVALQEQEMYRLGVTGVPFYIINQRYGISGAQSPEVFINALNKAGQEIVIAGESCDVDQKNC